MSFKNYVSSVVFVTKILLPFELWSKPDSPLAERRVKKPSGFQHFKLKKCKDSREWQKNNGKMTLTIGFWCSNFSGLGHQCISTTELIGPTKYFNFVDGFSLVQIFPSNIKSMTSGLVFVSSEYKFALGFQ